MRLYVARNLVDFDNDGNVTEYFEEVDDVELCVGTVHWHYDPVNSIDETTITCDSMSPG